MTTYCSQPTPDVVKGLNVTETEYPPPPEYYIEFLESAFPRWKSIELFGPPGAGKSHVCKLLHRTSGIYSSCLLNWNDLVPSNTVVFGSSRRWLPNRLRDKIARSIYQRRVAALRRKHDSPVAAFLSNMTRLLETGKIPALATRLFEKNVVRNVYLQCSGLDRFQKILIDEGVVFIVAYALSFFEYKESDYIIPIIEDVIREYPGDRNAILINSDVEECLIRQRRRKHIVSVDSEDQKRFHKASEQVADICRSSGWTVAILDH